MSVKKHLVELSTEQRSHVEKVARSNKASIRERVRARLLLAVDQAQPGGGQKDADAARAAGRCAVTAADVRRFVLAGLEAALHHREQARRKARKLGGEAEAHLVALGCGAPPAGRKRWSLHLLADQMVAAGFCEDLSHETVRQTLKKRAQALAQPLPAKAGRMGWD